MVSGVANIRNISEELPPMNERISIGGDDIWSLRGHQMYLINDLEFMVDKSFKYNNQGEFIRKDKSNIRIEI